MKVYIIRCESYWEDGEHIGGNTQGVYATKELAEQTVKELPIWEDNNGWLWRNEYLITEHEVQGV
jgi:hypothetical protein